MHYYEYDTTGWLVGWHEDANRTNSTPIDPAPIPGCRARWVDGTWTEDLTKETQEAMSAVRNAAVTAVQARLDAVAQSWGYDDIRSACTYVGDPYPRFDAEGTTLRNWRSATWAAVDQHQADVTSVEALIALLPLTPARPTA
jgi:hypothetical protein